MRISAFWVVVFLSILLVSLAGLAGCNAITKPGASHPEDTSLDPEGSRYEHPEGQPLEGGQAAEEPEAQAGVEASPVLKGEVEEPLEVLWYSQVTRDIPVRDAFILGENVYVETEAFELYSVDKENGHTKWIIGLPGPLAARPVKKGGNLSAVSASLLVEIDLGRGHIAHYHRLGFSPSSGVVLDDNNFYLSSWDGWLYALDQKTLKVNMTSRLKGAVLAFPAVAHSFIICATDEGFVQAINTLDGTTQWLFPRKHILHKIRINELWAGDVVAEDVKSEEGTVLLAKDTPVTYDTLEAIERSEIGDVWIYVTRGAYELPTKARFIGPVQVRGENVYAATTDGLLYCLRAQGGNYLWHANLPGPAITGMIVRDDTIFVPTFESGVVALKRQTGERQWWVKDGKDLLAATEGKIFLLTRDDKIMMVDEASGEALSSIELPQAVGEYHGITNFDSEVLYLFTSDGSFFALQGEPSK